MVPTLLVTLLLAVAAGTAPDRVDVTMLTGTYRWEEGGFVDLFTWSELGPGRLVAFDDQGGVRALTPEGPRLFSAGPAVAVPSPVAAHIRFDPAEGEPRVQALVWEAEGRPPRRARRVEDHRAEEVAFANGAVRLAGTLLLPLAPGPHPALVLVHGSNAQDRNGTLPFARFLVRHGVAILAYDKRGVGASEGDWRTAPFEALADDALAGVAMLRGRRDIDAKRIGILGVSQGGWIGPLAASRSRHVTLVVSVSGPGVTPAQQTLDLTEAELRLSGADDAEVQEAIGLMNLGFRYGRTGDGWDAYKAALSASGERPWLPYLSLPTDPHDQGWEQQRLFWHYDPRPALRSLRCPVLAIFGGMDLGVPAAKNLALWKESTARRGHRANRLVVLPAADHVMFAAKTGSLFEIAELDGFVPNYRPTLLSWVRERFRLRP